jgi:hypothetical protein
MAGSGRSYPYRAAPVIGSFKITNGGLLTGNSPFVIANIAGYCTMKPDPKQKLISLYQAENPP